MEKKTFNFNVEFKENADETGQFQAVFSRFDEIDKHGDITLKSAFTDGALVRISAWGHKWHELPVGKGVIHHDEEKAWVDGMFFLDTEGGRETYKTVKNLGELQEWSYGFDVLKSSNGKYEDQDVRYLESLEVFEISPVLIGAGNHTGTSFIKGSHTEPEQEDLPGENNSSDNSNNPEAKETEDETDGGKSSGVSNEDFIQLLDILEMEIEKNG